jgi:hypothetical protein
VDLDDGAEHVRQRGDGREPPPEPGAAAGPARISAHLPGDHEVVVAVGEPVPGGHRRRVHPAFHDGGAGTRADLVRVCTATQQQIEGRDHHRLAGTGLPGEHVQAGPEMQRDRVDDTDVTDSELFEGWQHDGECTRARRPPGPAGPRGSREVELVTHPGVEVERLRRAMRTGTSPRVTRTAPPCGTAIVSRPSRPTTQLLASPRGAPTAPRPDRPRRCG